MEIIDPHNLLPDTEMLLDIVQNHPLGSDLAVQVDTVEVFLSERCQIAYECVETEIASRGVRLGLGRSSKYKSNFRYILYHEFGHVVDRSDTLFGYSEEFKESLSESEKMAVMELWNVAIDARLNCVGLFELGTKTSCYTRKHGSLQNTVQGKLKGHAVMIENQGVSYDMAMQLLEGWWSNPAHVWSYADMISWVKKNGCQHATSPDQH